MSPKNLVFSHILEGPIDSARLVPRSLIKQALSELAGNEALKKPAVLARFREANQWLAPIPLNTDRNPRGGPILFEMTNGFKHPNAACRGLDTNLFYTDAKPRGRPARNASEEGEISEAQKVCQVCIVREQCLDYALKNGEDFGTWGGKNQDERRKMRRTGTAILATLTN